MSQFRTELLLCVVNVELEGTSSECHVGGILAQRRSLFCLFPTLKLPRARLAMTILVLGLHFCSRPSDHELNLSAPPSHDGATALGPAVTNACLAFASLIGPPQLGSPHSKRRQMHVDMSKLSCCLLMPCLCPPMGVPFEGLLPANTCPVLTLQNTPALRVKLTLPKTFGNAEYPHPTSSLLTAAPLGSAADSAPRCPSPTGEHTPEQVQTLSQAPTNSSVFNPDPLCPTGHPLSLIPPGSIALPAVDPLPALRRRYHMLPAVIT